MSTKIEWTDETWPVLSGCRDKSPGCKNCYAKRLAATRLKSHPRYRGLATMTAKGPQWTGEVRTNADVLAMPLHWRKPRNVFVASQSDLFHEAIPFHFLDKVFAVMSKTPHHTYQVLTKRPEAMAEYLLDDNLGSDLCEAWYRLTGEDPGEAPGFPFPNVWLGTSVEDQQRADERIPHLLRCPAAVRFLSCEPLLGPLELLQISDDADPECSALLFPLAGEFTTEGRNEPLPIRHGGIRWVIVGGESGPGARPMDVAWARSIVQQCDDAGVAVFVKQLGARPVLDEAYLPEWPAHVRFVGDNGSGRVVLRDPKGNDPEEWPEDLRAREFPDV